MNTEGPFALDVKAVSTRGKPKKRDRRSANLHFRLLTYTRAVFEKGLDYKFASEMLKSFAGSSGFSYKHLTERVFPIFRKNCREFKFERVRHGRSWRWKISPNAEIDGCVSLQEIGLRLGGAVRRVVELGGVAHVDREFLRKFCLLTKLDPAAVEIAWGRVKKIKGLEIEWRGVGAGVKFVARAEKNGKNNSSSTPQTSPVLSSLREKINENSGYAAGPEQETAGASRPTGRMEAPAGVVLDRLPPPDAQVPIRLEPSISRPLPRRFAALRPQLVCGRWIGPRKVFAKALWLGNGPLKNLHPEFPRVHFDGRHAVNFAFECLWFGYAEDQIWAAWREGLRKSHADSVDAGEGGGATRPPSAAKVYAIAALREADSRPPAERWAELFAVPAPVPAERGQTGGGAAVGLANVPVVSRKNYSAPTLSELREKIAAVPSAPAAVSLPELRTACEKIGLTLPKFNALSWIFKKSIIDKILREKDLRDG